jgi:hypothetical protein
MRAQFKKFQTNATVWPRFAVQCRKVVGYNPYGFCWRARRSAAQPSLTIWRARPTASAPAGTFWVMQELAPM